MEKKAKKHLEFWIAVIEKLNTNTDVHDPLTEVFESICKFFEVGCAFLYRADERGTFLLKESYKMVECGSIVEELFLADVLGKEYMKELSKRKIVVSTGDENESELELRLKGLFKSKILTIIPVIDQNDEVAGIVGFIDRRGIERFDNEDIFLANAVLGAVANRVKLQIYKERIDRAKTALERMLDNMGFDVYVNDFYTHEVLYVNKSMAEPYGGPENMIGRECYKALYEDQDQQCEFCPQKQLIDENGRPTKVYSWDYKRPFDGAWFRVISAAFPWVNGRLAHVVSSVDISENKRNEDTIRKMAMEDMLTSMPNRRKMIQEIERLTESIDSGKKEKLYLLFIDLNNFKVINDRYGHSEGDELLKVVSKAINEHPISRDKSYRFGGDEFVILLADPSYDQLLEMVVFLKYELMAEYTPLCDDVIYNASVGIACYPEDAQNSDDLMHFADMAMYKSKENAGKKVYFYNKGEMLNCDEYFEIKKNAQNI